MFTHFTNTTGSSYDDWASRVINTPIRGASSASDRNETVNQSGDVRTIDHPPALEEHSNYNFSQGQGNEVELSLQHGAKRLCTVLSGSPQSDRPESPSAKRRKLEFASGLEINGAELAGSGNKEFDL
jgi:hypothetical protein